LVPSGERPARRKPREAIPDEAAGQQLDEDEQLVSRARQGDREAMDRLIRRHQRHALAIALSLVKDEQDAHEVVQEAFLRVHRGLPDFHGSSTFFTWLYRIVTNVSIDVMRKPQRRESEPLDLSWLELATEVPCLAQLDGDPFEVLRRRELVLRIGRSLDALPPYHRGVIVMRELDGLSYEEMAKKMGVSKGTIMSRLFHARLKLQRALMSDYQEQFGVDFCSEVVPA
jgi:RNA polymerase sigma-70 factor (ECF subfamily)